MSQGRPEQRGVRRAGMLVLLVGALLGGLVGMHGLGMHGLAGAGAGAEAGAAVAAAQVSGAHAEEHHPADVVGQHDQGGHHGMGEMAMLCVAMLVAAVSALIVLALVRRMSRPWLLPRVRLRVALPRGSAGADDTGPPVEWEFSVLRC